MTENKTSQEIYEHCSVLVRNLYGRILNQETVIEIYDMIKTLDDEHKTMFLLIAMTQIIGKKY